MKYKSFPLPIPCARTPLSSHTHSHLPTVVGLRLLLGVSRAFAPFNSKSVKRIDAPRDPGTIPKPFIPRWLLVCGSCCSATVRACSLWEPSGVTDLIFRVSLCVGGTDGAAGGFKYWPGSLAAWCFEGRCSLIRTHCEATPNIQRSEH